MKHEIMLKIAIEPPKLSQQQQQEIAKLVRQGDKTPADAARLFRVHPSTVSRLLKQIQ